MRYRHGKTICEFVRRVGDNLLCVDVADRNHYLSYPLAQWERVA